MVVIDPKILAEAILQKHGPIATIGIDGWTGVGKTTLAKNLAVATGGQFYDLDIALDTGRNFYVDALRLDEIRNAIASSDLLFVSGICIRQVFAKVGIEADTHVYVKRMASWGWADEDELLEPIPKFCAGGGDAMRREMRSYHQKWKPHMQMAYEFHRYE